MSETLLALGLTTLGCVPLLASHRARHDPGGAVRCARHRRRIAAAAALAQLALGALLLGVAHGVALVLGGWMALGIPFVAAVNRAPARALASAAVLGAAGGLLLASGLLLGAL